jgi:hypothetical protein
MTKQTLTQDELKAMVSSCGQADYGPEIVIEIVPEEWDDEYDECEDDGQPTEYEEWQDYYDGDDWDQGQYDCMDY